MKTTKSFTHIVAAVLSLLLVVPAALGGLWTPEDLGDRLWLDWWQEDLSNGAVSSWTSRKGSVAATQGTVANQPTKASGEVYFANAQRLNLPSQGYAFLTHRAICIVFRIDLTGSGDGAIFAANGITGGNEREPIVLYNRNSNTVSVQWKTPGGYNDISWTVAENASQWHCIVSRRVGNVHYASLDGQPEQSVTMADAAIPKNAVPGYIGDFRTSTPNMAIDSVMIVQDELSQAEAQKLMGWAMWRKGIQSTLPAGHPYKNQPPLQGNGVLAAQDVGSPLPAGTTAISAPSNFTLAGGGTGLGATSDNFHFASQNVEGDAEMIVKVDSLTNTSASAKAGLMMRGSTAANSAYVGIFARPGTNGVAMQWRTTNGGTMSSTTTASMALPRWLKLTRTGDSFTGYQSSDGSTWTAVNTVSVTLPKISPGGLIATSAVQSTTATAVFSSLTIQDSTAVAEFVESTPSEWTALQTFWNDTTQSEAFKGTNLNLTGWNVNFEENFDSHTITNDVTGEGPWYAPTHGDACGAATAVTPTDAVPQGSPTTYIQGSGAMTVRMKQVSGTWRSGVFCSVNSNGYGRTWMYPYFEVRMKIGGNGHGAWPAVWVKSENSMFNLCQSYLEYDVYEGYAGDNDGFHNTIHNWPANRLFPGRLTTHRYLSNYLGMHTPGWYQNVNLFDNAYHTYGVMITPKWVINVFDGKEMFRFPTPVEMKQPMWTLVSLALGGGASEVAAAAGIYDLTVDYVKIYQNPAFSGAAIRSTFIDGAGSASADQYPGRADDGWASGWVENSATDLDVSVVNTTPLALGSDSYLSIVNNDTSTGGSNDTLIRQYSSANGVNLAAPHTISFDYRLDSPASQLTANDAIVFFNNDTSGVDSGPTNGYTLSGYYDGGVFQWRWFNGNKAGSGAWATTGMAVVTGTVYHFTINVDPVNKQYVVSINNGTTTVTSPTLGYRTAASAPVSLSYLCFGSRDATSGQTMTQSFDNLAITAP